VFYARHAHPQISQILDLPHVNAVIRQETLDEDWARAQDLLGVPPEKRVPIKENNIAGKITKRVDEPLYRREPGPRLWGGVAGPRAQKNEALSQDQSNALGQERRRPPRGVPTALPRLRVLQLHAASDLPRHQDADARDGALLDRLPRLRRARAVRRPFQENGRMGSAGG